MRFLLSLQQDAKLFIYIHALLMLFRCAFLVIYSGQLGNAGAEDVAEALWLGARISLKTAAFLVGFPFVFGTIPYALWKKWPAGGIRKILGSVAVGLMTLLFMVRIPYYEIFHQGFNIMLFNGMKDDRMAIWQTAVQQYQLWPRLFGALALMAFFIWGLIKFLETPVYYPRHHVRILDMAAVVMVPVFAVFCRFGGAFHSDSGVPWESAARTQYTVLNEAVLDDGQAMYRAYHTHARATQRAMRPISDGELYEAIAALGGNPDAGTPITAFERRTTAAPLERRPHHVVVLLVIMMMLFIMAVLVIVVMVLIFIMVIFVVVMVFMFFFLHAFRHFFFIQFDGIHHFECFELALVYGA